MTWELGLAVFGTMAGAYGQASQGRYEEQRAAYQSAVLEQKARQAREEGRIETGRLVGRQKAARAGYRARVGASGVTFEGSPTEVLFEQEKLDRFDQAMLMHEYDLKAYDLLTGATETLWQGESGYYRSRVGAFESLLGAGSKVAGYYRV
ncbi:MAG: hypothetical protein AB1896_23495 [Thermodesulfobacteriota bacterium]